MPTSILGVMLAAGDLWTKMNAQWTSLEQTGKNGLKAIGVVLIVLCIAKGGTIVKMLGVALMVGLGLYLVYNLTSVQNTVTDTVDPATTSMGPLVQTGGQSPPPTWLLGSAA